MPKFVVTLVVETEKDKPAPTKKAVKEWLSLLEGDPIYSDATTDEPAHAVKVRVRAVDFD